MDWTEKKREEAEKTLLRWYRKTDQVKEWSIPVYDVLEALEDDLNTSLALSRMRSLSPEQLRSAMKLMGLGTSETVDWWREKSVDTTMYGSTGDTPLFSSEIRPFLEQWQKLRDEKNYVQADELKKELEATGLKLSATLGVPRAEISAEFSPSKLEALRKYLGGTT